MTGCLPLTRSELEQAPSVMCVFEMNVELLKCHSLKSVLQRWFLLWRVALTSCSVQPVFVIVLYVLQSDHQNKMASGVHLYISANHGYVKFLRFLRNISTFLQYLCVYELTFVSGGEGNDVGRSCLTSNRFFNQLCFLAAKLDIF